MGREGGGCGAALIAHIEHRMIVEMGGMIAGRNHEQGFVYLISNEY